MRWRVVGSDIRIVVVENRNSARPHRVDEPRFLARRDIERLEIHRVSPGNAHPHCDVGAKHARKVLHLPGSAYANLDDGEPVPGPDPEDGKEQALVVV